jgi:hypothetical protein
MTLNHQGLHLSTVILFSIVYIVLMGRVQVTRILKRSSYLGQLNSGIGAGHFIVAMLRVNMLLLYLE